MPGTEFHVALACTFGPLVDQRLRALQEGIRSVPAVEVGSRCITGHATTRERIAVIAEAAGEPDTATRLRSGANRSSGPS